MRSNYKRIGDHIRLVDERNYGLKVKQLLGLSISKQFIPSVANIIGTDMENYKIIRKNQFACSVMQVRRDKKMPVALLTQIDEAIISQAYPLFEVKDENEILPEYLMMWFMRPEFDREACFNAVGGVRGSLEWEDFCNMKLPVPSITKQQEIVAEYNVIQDRIKLNQQLIQNLEETAHAIYKHWFVDFEFPISAEQAATMGRRELEGKPYKSSGGEMVESELGEMPKGWGVDSFTKIVCLSGGGTPSTLQQEYWDGEIPFYTPGDLSKYYYTIGTNKSITPLGLEKCSSKLFPSNTTFVTARGATVGGIALAGIPMAMNQTCYAINSKHRHDFYAHQLSLATISSLKNEAVGATFEALVTKNFDSKKVISPEKQIIKLFDQRVTSIYKYILNSVHQQHKLEDLKALLLSKLATIEHPHHERNQTTTSDHEKVKEKISAPQQTIQS